MSHKHDHSRGIDTVAHLAEHVGELMTPGSVVVCVGNDLCGDDAAGPGVARCIEGQVPWKVFDVQSTPENFLMKIVEAKPDTVLLVDALSFDAEAGSVELFASEAVTGQGPSTHGPAPIAFLDVLNMMHPCRRVVLGIQPLRGGFGEEMSEPVSAAVEFVCQALRQAGKAAAPQA